MELRANAASQSDSPATRAATFTGDPLHSRAACTQPCNVNTHSRAHCSPGARLCEQWGHGCVNNGARLCASARLCRGSPVTFPAQHTTIGIGIRSSCCSFLATQTMVCSKMKDRIWQKARDKKHFIRDEIYWWQRERTLMGHAHILWVLLSAARIAVRALNCITYHVAEPVRVWNGLCAPASKPSNLLNSCVFILDAL